MHNICNYLHLFRLNLCYVKHQRIYEQLKMKFTWNNVWDPGSTKNGAKGKHWKLEYTWKLRFKDLKKFTVNNLISNKMSFFLPRKHFDGLFVIFYFLFSSAQMRVNIIAMEGCVRMCERKATATATKMNERRPFHN